MFSAGNHQACIFNCLVIILFSQRSSVGWSKLFFQLVIWQERIDFRCLFVTWFRFLFRSANWKKKTQWFAQFCDLLLEKNNKHLQKKYIWVTKLDEDCPYLCLPGCNPWCFVVCTDSGTWGSGRQGLCLGHSSWCSCRELGLAWTQ